MQQACKYLLTNSFEKQSYTQTWIVRTLGNQTAGFTFPLVEPRNSRMFMEGNIDFRSDASCGSSPHRQDPNKEAGDFGDPLGLGQYNEEFRNKARSVGSPGGIPVHRGMSIEQYSGRVACLSLRSSSECM